MMVLASTGDQKQLIGTTVIEVPSQDGKRHATTVLIDNGFTGYAIMTHSFAENLGYASVAPEKHIARQQETWKHPSP